METKKGEKPPNERFERIFPLSHVEEGLLLQTNILEQFCDLLLCKAIDDEIFLRSEDAKTILNRQEEGH